MNLLERPKEHTGIPKDGEEIVFTLPYAHTWWRVWRDPSDSKVMLWCMEKPHHIWVMGWKQFLELGPWVSDTDQRAKANAFLDELLGPNWRSKPKP